MEQQFNSPEELMMSDQFQEYVKKPTPDLENHWEAWKREFPAQAHWVEEARQMLNNLSYPYEISPGDKKKLWNKIITDVAEVEEVATVPITSMRRSWYLVAASIVFFIISMSLFYVFKTDIFSPTEYKSAFGEVKKVELPDGSIVTLNGNSSLRFKDDWESSSLREVWIKGEAFFKVAKVTNTATRRKIKFVVHTGQLDVEVLGTQFNVQNRKEKTEIALQEGKVRVLFSNDGGKSGGIPRREIIMAPGDLISYARQSKGVVYKKLNSETYGLWKEHKYYFDNTSLREVILLLEETYGVDIEVENDSLLNQTIKGTVASQNLNVMLKAISITGKMHVTQANGKIFFRQK